MRPVTGDGDGIIVMGAHRDWTGLDWTVDTTVYAPSRAHPISCTYPKTLSPHVRVPLARLPTPRATRGGAVKCLVGHPKWRGVSARRCRTFTSALACLGWEQCKQVFSLRNPLVCVSINMHADLALKYLIQTSLESSPRHSCRKKKTANVSYAPSTYWTGPPPDTAIIVMVQM